MTKERAIKQTDVCYRKKKGRILTILSAFVLFGLSFTLSSCSSCEKSGKKENHVSSENVSEGSLEIVPSENVVARGREFTAKAKELIVETENVIANAKTFKDKRAKVASDDWKIEDPIEALRQEEDFVRVQIKKVEPVINGNSSKIELERYIVNHKIKQNMDEATKKCGTIIVENGGKITFSGTGGECFGAMYEFNNALLKWKVAVDEFNKAVDEFNKL
jgi:hypothetical protein